MTQPQTEHRTLSARIVEQYRDIISNNKTTDNSLSSLGELVTVLWNQRFVESVTRKEKKKQRCADGS